MHDSCAPGGHSYHIYHPFNVLLNSGRASQKQIRAWVANRCDDRDVRREWVLRILDQDGHGNDPGGIESWVRLGEAVGLPVTELWSMQHVPPSVRFAVDAYVSSPRASRDLACPLPVDRELRS